MGFYDWCENKAAVLIGYLEFLGLKYPVKTYEFQVSSILWRGSRLPNLDAYLDLRHRGFGSIISLCAERDLDSENAHRTGLKSIRIRIIDNTPPTEQQMIDFLRHVAEPRNQPAFVHCEAGKGRTGVAVACYRMAVDNWSYRQALDEAQKFGLCLASQERFLLRFSVDGVRRWRESNAS